MQKFTDPFTLSTPPLKSAKLVGSFFGGRTFEIKLIVENKYKPADPTVPLNISVLTLPANAEGYPGVYKLLLETLDPDCCPRCGPMYWEGCPPSGYIGEDGGGGDDDLIPTCDPKPPASTDPTSIQHLTPTCIKLSMARGVDMVRSWTWTNPDGVPYDLTSTTAEIQFTNKEDKTKPPAVVLTLSSADGGIVLGKASGNILMLIRAAASAGLERGEYEGMLMLTLSDGRKLAFAEIEITIIEV